jgi:hypothetical protein
MLLNSEKKRNKNNIMFLKLAESIHFLQMGPWVHNVYKYDLLYNNPILKYPPPTSLSLWTV